MRSYTLLTRLACILLTALSMFGAAIAQSVYSANTEYHIGDLVQGGPEVDSTHNVYRCIKEVTKGVGGEPNVDYSHWELNYVAGPASNPVTTILIGTSGVNIGPFPNLQTAWTYIQNARIAQSATLKLVIQASQSLGGSFNLDHPFGANIILEGSSPGIVLSFPAGVNGLTIDSGHTFGGLVDLEVSGPSSPLTPLVFGIFAVASASIGLIENVNINGFVGSVGVERSANLAFSGVIKLSGFSGAGCVAAFGGSATFAKGSLSVSCPPMASTSTTGLFAFGQSLISAQGCAITGCTAIGGGVTALQYGVVDISNGSSISYAHLSSPVYAATGGHVDAENDNTFGVCSVSASVVDGLTTFTILNPTSVSTDGGAGSLINLAGSDYALSVQSFIASHPDTETTNTIPPPLTNILIQGTWQIGPPGWSIGP